MKRVTQAAIAACILAGCSLGGGSVAPGLPRATERSGLPLAKLPEVVSSHHVVSFDLSSDTNAASKFPEFVYKGQPATEPTIRVNPGDTIVLNLHNGLYQQSGMAADLNVHFHGLGVSPNKPSDDVLTMLSRPGGTLHYVVHVPTSQPPGFYWYHPHVHGETSYQVGQGGMSGAIVVNGIENHYPQVANATEELMIVRSVGGQAGEEELAQHRRRLENVVRPHSPCPVFYNAILTVNGQTVPTVTFQPGKPLFFRILNATGHRTIDISIPGVSLQVIGIDGFPVDEEPGPKMLTKSDFVLPPAARVEFLATPTRATTLKTSCYDSGPGGDTDPGQVLAVLHPGSGQTAPAPNAARTAQLAPNVPLPALPPPAAHRVVIFSEDSNGFYINGKAFDPSAPPMFVVHTGTIERWTVSNITPEFHDFHLHQVHFLVVSIDGVAVKNPVWSDTFVVPWQTAKNKPGTVELLADFRSKIIKGTFLFHCHILDHEDNGMMAKIQAI